MTRHSVFSGLFAAASNKQMCLLVPETSRLAPVEIVGYVETKQSLPRHLDLISSRVFRLCSLALIRGVLSINQVEQLSYRLTHSSN